MLRPHDFSVPLAVKPLCPGMGTGNGGKKVEKVAFMLWHKQAILRMNLCRSISLGYTSDAHYSARGKNPMEPFLGLEKMGFFVLFLAREEPD